MTLRRFKGTQFREGTVDFSLKCIQLLKNDFFKQQYRIFNAIIPGQDRIYPNTHLCRTFLLGILTLEIAEHKLYQIVVGVLNFDPWPEQQELAQRSMLYMKKKILIQAMQCFYGTLLPTRSFSKPRPLR